MAFEWDPTQRSAFDEALIEQVALVFPEVAFGWTECERRLLVTFPDGAICSLWEPNFFFSHPSFSLEWIYGRAIEVITEQHQASFDRASNE